MQKQRPPRGQAWPGAGVCPESGVFNLVCSTIWVFRFTLVHLLVIWQCPPGTEFGNDLLQFNSFSVHPVFQRTSGLRTRNYIGLWFISVSILWGRAPQKLLTKFFKFLEKILCPKNYFFNFGSKNYADWFNLVSGVRENSFFDEKLSLKNFDFWT